MATIDEIPEVVVDPEGGYKFIVAKVFDGNGGERLVVRADKNQGYHDDILDGLRREVRPNDLRAKCIGGGRINVDPVAKTIKVWDFSGAFGREPDRTQTVAMLQSAYPEYQVTGTR